MSVAAIQYNIIYKNTAGFGQRAMWQTTSWPNGIECPETDPGTYKNLVHDKSGISNHWGTFLKNWRLADL